jgi:hypothetical protein
MDPEITMERIMMKKIAILIPSLFSLLFSILSAQNVSTRLTINYNSFSLNDLHHLENQIIEKYQNMGIGVKKFGSFPPCFGFQFQCLGVKNGIFNYGLFYGFTTTGSRVQYQDYSGEFKTELSLFRWSFGLTGETTAMKSPIINLIVFSQASIHFTRFKSEEMLSINSSIPRHSLVINKYRLFGASIALGLALPLHFWGQIAQLCASYESDILDKSLPFQDSAGRKLKCNWSGARLGLTYYLTKDRQFRFR